MALDSSSSSSVFSRPSATAWILSFELDEVERSWARIDISITSSAPEGPGGRQVGLPVATVKSSRNKYH